MPRFTDKNRIEQTMSARILNTDQRDKDIFDAYVDMMKSDERRDFTSKSYYWIKLGDQFRLEPDTISRIVNGMLKGSTRKRKNAETTC